MFRDSLRKFLQERSGSHTTIHGKKTGLFQSRFGKSLGRWDFSVRKWMINTAGLVWILASVSLSGKRLERVGTGLTGVGLHNDIVVPYIESFGTMEQKERWLPGCVSADNITAIAMTEPGTGSDLANIQTTAIKDGDHYVVNGQKTFITNGINGNLMLVAVKTDPYAEPKHRGISLLIIEEGTPGFTKGRKLDKVGLHSQDTAELFFEDCRVPVANLIGEEGKGFSYMMEKLQQERLVVAIAAQTASEDMLELTLGYVKSRKAFDKPIGSFQNTQFKLAEIATKVEIGKTFWNHLSKII